MKFVFISDTHNLHRWLKVPDGDVIIHAGDMTMGGKDYEVSDFANWYGSLPHKHKIAIAGNHDWLFQRKPSLAQGIFKNYGIQYLQDEAITIEGLKIYGTPWQPWFCNWAFNLNRGNDIKERWDLIPDDLDVLVTHGPPFGIMDEIYGDKVGCEELAKAIARVRPRISVFGHIHSGYGYQVQDFTEYFNAAICNNDYKLTNEPFVIELEPRI